MRVSGSLVQKTFIGGNEGLIPRPYFILSTRILNYTSRRQPVKISFRAEGILFHPSGKIIPHTQKLSRRIFQAASIRDVTFKRGIKHAKKFAQALRQFCATGDIRKIDHFYQDITLLPPLEQMLEEGRPMIDLPVSLAAIPGKYKHYTDLKGYRGIFDKQAIWASSYQGRASRLCLSTSSLTPAQAWERLFIGNPHYVDKGEYVFGFDLSGEQGLEQKSSGDGEYWFRGKIKFGRNTQLRFAGLNPVAQAVQPFSLS